jgi:hypothetical protein
LRAIRFVAWALAVPGLLAVAQVLAGGFQVVDLPWATNPPEAYVLDGALRVAEGRAPYGRLGELPFVTHVYNPLTYVTAGGLAAALRLDVFGTLVAGRVLALGSSLLLGAVLFATVRARTGSAKLGLLAGLAPFFFFRILLTDFFRMRPESPGLLLTFAGAGAVLCGKRPALAGVLFALALGWKQSFVAAPAAALAHFALARRWRDFLELGGTMAGLLALGGAAVALWAGEAWVDCAVRALAANPVHPVQAFRDQGGPLARAVGGLFLAAPFALARLAAERRHAFLSIYAALCGGWTLYSAGKVGASLNYWSELGVLLVLVAALGAARGGPARGALAAAALLCVAGNVLAGVLTGAPTRAWRQAVHAPRGDFATYVERFGAHEGPRLIMEERVAVQVRDPEVLDWLLLQVLSRGGLVDAGPLYRRVADGHYGLVAIDPLSSTPQGKAFARKIREAVERGPYRRIWQGQPWNAMDVFERIAAAPRAAHGSAGSAPRRRGRPTPRSAGARTIPSPPSAAASETARVARRSGVGFSRARTSWRPAPTASSTFPVRARGEVAAGSPFTRASQPGYHTSSSTTVTESRASTTKS